LALVMDVAGDLNADGLVDLVDINVTGGVLSPTNLESILGGQFRAE